MLARLLIHEPRWVVIDEVLDAIDGETRTRALEILSRDLKDAAIIHIGRGKRAGPTFTRFFHLIKDPEIRRLVREKPAETPGLHPGCRLQRARDGPGSECLGSPSGCGGLVACRRGRGGARPLVGIGRRTAGAAAGFRLQRRGGVSWSPAVRCSRRCTRTTRLRSGCAAWVGPTTSSSSSSTRAGRTSGGTSKENLQPPARWKHFRIDSREFEFAWGPASGGVPKDLGAIELAIVAGDGGAGTLWVSDLRIEDHGSLTGARASASSALPGFDADQALGGSGWIPSPDDARPWIAVDFTEARRLGGLIIDWRDGAPASGFRVRASSRGRRWRTLYTTPRAGGARSYVYLPNLKTRLLRLELNAPFAGAAVCTPSRSSSARSIEAFCYSIARHEPRGWYPRWLHREQTLWTPIGTANGTHCALMNEEGAVELAPGAFSIEPMVVIDGRLFTWADVVQRQELLEGVLPVPSAIWETAAWRLRVQGEATESGLVRLRYRLENRSDRSLIGAPAGARSSVPGDSALAERRQDWRREPRPRPGMGGGALRVNETAAIVPASAPSGFAATSVRRGFRRAASCHSRPRARGHASSRCAWLCFRRARLRSGARALAQRRSASWNVRPRIPRSQSGSRHSIGRRSFPQRSGPAPGGRWTPSAPRSRRRRTYS